MSYQQFKEAKEEHIKAQQAFLKAQTTEMQIREVGKAMAKVSAGLSTTGNTFERIEVLKFFPALMKTQADSLLNAIAATPEERKDTYRIPYLVNEWLKKGIDSPEGKILENRIYRETNR